MVRPPHQWINCFRCNPSVGQTLKSTSGFSEVTASFGRRHRVLWPTARHGRGPGPGPPPPPGTRFAFIAEEILLHRLHKRAARLWSLSAPPGPGAQRQGTTAGRDTRRIAIKLPGPRRSGGRAGSRARDDALVKMGPEGGGGRDCV